MKSWEKAEPEITEGEHKVFVMSTCLPMTADSQGIYKKIYMLNSYNT